MGLNVSSLCVQFRVRGTAQPKSIFHPETRDFGYSANQQDRTISLSPQRVEFDQSVWSEARPVVVRSSVKAAFMAASGPSGGGDKQLKLYSYWRSSCSFRVRIALNLKGLKYEYKAVNLVKGEQFSTEFTKLNPIGYVPVLVDGDIVVADSFAILMYLEDKYPQHPLLPQDLQKKAINYQASNIVSSSIQPLQNLAVLKYIEEKVSPEEKLEWVKVHIGKGFAALEELLRNYAGRYATGDEVFLADLFLAPQLYAATTRFHLDMTKFPLLARLHEAYNNIPEFIDAIPENQPDAPSS